MPFATTAELAELIRPFVGAKLRDENGQLKPRTASVDIEYGPFGSFIAGNADIRGVTGEGIKRFFYDRCETIAWGDIRTVAIRRIDGMGDTLGCMTFAHSGYGGPGAACVGCGEPKPIREIIDGDALCQDCCNTWARGEGEAEREHRRQRVGEAA